MRMRIITKEQDENEISKNENQNNWKRTGWEWNK